MANTQVRTFTSGDCVVIGVRVLTGGDAVSLSISAEFVRRANRDSAWSHRDSSGGCKKMHPTHETGQRSTPGWDAVPAFMACCRTFIAGGYGGACLESISGAWGDHYS